MQPKIKNEEVITIQIPKIVCRKEWAQEYVHCINEFMSKIIACKQDEFENAGSLLDYSYTYADSQTIPICCDRKEYDSCFDTYPQFETFEKYVKVEDEPWRCTEEATKVWLADKEKKNNG